MKIIKNILDDDTLKLIHSDLKKQAKEYAWMNSRLVWEHNLYKNSTIGNISQTTVSDNIHSIVAYQIKNKSKIKYQKIVIQHCVWEPLSGLNIHTDDRYKFSATIYLNKTWDINWGGWFVYLKGKQYIAIPPEYNTCIMNTDHTPHMVSQISPLIKHHRHTLQIWGI